MIYTLPKFYFDFTYVNFNFTTQKTLQTSDSVISLQWASDNLFLKIWEKQVNLNFIWEICSLLYHHCILILSIKYLYCSLPSWSVVDLSSPLPSSGGGREDSQCWLGFVSQSRPSTSSDTTDSEQLLTTLYKTVLRNQIYTMYSAVLFFWGMVKRLLKTIIWRCFFYLGDLLFLVSNPSFTYFHENKCLQLLTKLILNETFCSLHYSFQG